MESLCITGDSEERGWADSVLFLFPIFRTQLGHVLLRYRFYISSSSIIINCGRRAHLLPKGFTCVIHHMDGLLPVTYRRMYIVSHKVVSGQGPRSTQGFWGVFWAQGYVDDRDKGNLMVMGASEASTGALKTLSRLMKVPWRPNWTLTQMLNLLAGS